MSQNRSTTT